MGAKKGNQTSSGIYAGPDLLDPEDCSVLTAPRDDTDSAKIPFMTDPRIFGS